MPQIGWSELLVIIVLASTNYWAQGFARCRKKNHFVNKENKIIRI